jgi:hypothetical protein
VDDTADELLVPLKYYLRVATHPTSHVFSTFPRSGKHDQEFHAAEASNDTPVATDYILQTLSKIDHARVFLTTHHQIRTNAVAPLSDSPGLIHFRQNLMFASATSYRRLVRRVSRSPVQMRSPFIVRAPFSDQPSLFVGSRIGTAAPILT